MARLITTEMVLEKQCFDEWWARYRRYYDYTRVAFWTLESLAALSLIGRLTGLHCDDWVIVVTMLLPTIPVVAGTLIDVRMGKRLRAIEKVLFGRVK